MLEAKRALADLWERSPAACFDVFFSAMAERGCGMVVVGLLPGAPWPILQTNVQILDVGAAPLAQVIGKALLAAGVPDRLVAGFAAAGAEAAIRFAEKYAAKRAAQAAQQGGQR